MRGFLTIYRRELAGLFLAPLAWFLLFLTLVYDGLFFVHYLRTTGGEVNASLELTLGGGLPFWFLMVLLPPLITMRMISEESKSGLLEFLLTAPVRDGAVVLGKAAAATSFLACLWATVPLYALVVQLLGAEPDWGQVLTAYVGAVLVSALFSAIGLVTSAASGTPLFAAFLAMVVNLFLIFLPFAGRSVRDVSPVLVDWLLERVSVVGTFQGSFLTGAFDSAHVVFFVAWIAVLLFVAVRLLEARRWWA